MGQIEVLMDLGEPYVRLKDYRAVQARAETAEADADLRATERDSAIDRALSAEMQLEAAKAQLAALQAAGEWRPVDDKPAHGQDVEVCAILTGVWWDDDGIFDVYQVPDEITIKGWRPAPPQE